MSMLVIKKSCVVLLSSGVGLVGATVVATPAIAAMNYLATDGPYFPALLVAFGLLALPIGCMLLLMQALTVAYEVIRGRGLGSALLLVGVIGGLATGIAWYHVLESSRSSTWMLLAVAGLGVFQATLVFGCQWAGNGWIDG